VPFDRTGGELLFNVLTERNERRSIVATNLAFAEWIEVFGGDEKLTTALLDRLAHHATVVATKGKSFRMRRERTHPTSDREEATTEAWPEGIGIEPPGGSVSERWQHRPGARANEPTGESGASGERAAADSRPDAGRACRSSRGRRCRADGWTSRCRNRDCGRGVADRLDALSTSSPPDRVGQKNEAPRQDAPVGGSARGTTRHKRREPLSGWGGNGGGSTGCEPGGELL
jgi:hypothetical protein